MAASRALAAVALPVAVNSLGALLAVGGLGATESLAALEVTEALAAIGSAGGDGGNSDYGGHS